MTWNVVINRKKVFSSDDKELAEMVLNSIKNEDAKCYTITQKDDYPIYYPIYKRLMKIAEIAKSEISEDLLKPIFQGLPKMPGDSKKYQYTPSQTPPQRVIKNILKHSKSKNFEEAKTEWEFRGEIIEDTSPLFSKCQLCHNSLLLVNCVIYNIYTNERLQVGPVCVKRFIWINRATSQEESVEIFDELYNQSVLRTYLKRMLPYLADDVISENVLLKLIDICKQIFKDDFESDKYDELVNSLEIKKDDIVERKLFLIATGNLKELSKIINVRQMKEVVNDYRGKIRRRVATTLSRSEAYKIP